MNELQVWFPGCNATYSNWIYFKTYATDLDDAIKDFKDTLKGSGIDLADMQPVQYDLWDKNQNHIKCKLVDKTEIQF